MVVSDINNSRVSDNSHHFFVRGEHVPNHAMKTSPSLFRPRFHAAHHFANLLGLFSIFFAVNPVAWISSVFVCKRFNGANINDAAQPDIHWSVCRHTVTVHVLCPCQHRAVRFCGDYRVPVDFLHHALGIRQQLAPGGGRGSRHIHFVERAGLGAALTVERVRSDLVCQLPLVQHVGHEGVRLLLRQLARGLACCEQLLQNGRQNGFRAVLELRKSAHFFPAQVLLHLAARIRLPAIRVVLHVHVIIIKQIIVNVLPGFRVLFARLAHHLAIQVVLLCPDLAVVRQVLADHGGRIQRRVIVACHGIVQVEAALGGQHNGAFVAFAGWPLVNDGHERVFLAAFFGHVARQLDALAANDQETDGHAANLRHFVVARDHVHLLHEMVHEVAILNAVFGNDGARTGALIRHAENVLRRHVVLGDAPAHVLLHVGCLVSDDFEIAGRTVNCDDLEFLAVFVGVGGVPRLFQLDVVADLQASEILADNPSHLSIGYY